MPSDIRSSCLPDRLHLFAHGRADVRRQVPVLGRERLGVILDPLGETADGLGAALDVALHGLDDSRGLARHHLAVLLHLLQDRLGEGAVTLVEGLERLGDVALDLLELVPHALDAVKGGGVCDLPDGRDGCLHRLPGRPAGLGKIGERILDTAGPGRERLEALVARRDQAPDGLVA